jgi:hypothetical protein
MPRPLQFACKHGLPWIFLAAAARPAKLAAYKMWRCARTEFPDRHPFHARTRKPELVAVASSFR